MEGNSLLRMPPGSKEVIVQKPVCGVGVFTISHPLRQPHFAVCNPEMKQPTPRKVIIGTTNYSDFARIPMSAKKKKGTLEHGEDTMNQHPIRSH